MKRTELLVEGMSCGSCVNHVDRAVRELSGVSQVEVRLRDGKVFVEHDPNASDTPALIASIKAAGYEAKPVT
jgi:copper chaperone CopZ